MRPLLRRLWRVPLVASWVAFALLLAVQLSLWPAHRRAAVRERLTGFWMRGLVRLLPLRVRHHGRPVAQTAVWVGNHISWLDIILLGTAAPVRFIAKSDVRQWPVLGWLAQQAGTLFIRRGQASTGNLHQQMTEVLEQQHSLMVFAEGTTTLGDRVGTFHGRLLGPAIEHQVPVQPVALRYQQRGGPARTAAFIDDDEFFSHLWRLLGDTTIDVDLHFLPALDTHDLQRNILARRAQQAVTQALGLEVSIVSQSAASLSAAA